MNVKEIIDQLSPNNRALAESLILQLAQQDGIKVNITGTFKLPIDNLPLWVASMRSGGKSDGTIMGYSYSAKRILAAIPKPTYFDLQGYFAKRLDNVSAACVNSEQKAMKSLFKYLFKFGLYPADPAKDIELIHDVAKHPELPTEEQINACIVYVPVREKDRPKYRTMLVLLTGTGLRISEACGLERQFVDFKAHEIKVLGKGNKERYVPLLPIVESALRDYLDINRESKSKFVFPDSHDNGSTYNGSFRRTLQLACTKAGQPPIHPHQLRHYFATKTLEHGAKLEVISRILGHSDVGITAGTYRHIKVAEYHREIEKHGDTLQLSDGRPVVEGEAKELTDGQ